MDQRSILVDVWKERVVYGNHVKKNNNYKNQTMKVIEINLAVVKR